VLFRTQTGDRNTNNETPCASAIFLSTFRFDIAQAVRKET
jgi:hypothetical protein